jgi:hypothetical protein
VSVTNPLDGRSTTPGELTAILPPDCQKGLIFRPAGGRKL